MKRRSLLLILPILLASACGERSDPLAGVEVHDEGGVRVVVNHTPEHAPGSWAIAAEPRLQIGEVDGAEPYLFQRVAHAHVMGDGRIVIVDAGASSIRVFSPQGEHLRSEGRVGAGPGEFRNVVAVQRMRGDTLALTEFMGRTSFFDEEGRFVRTFTPTTRPGPSHYLASDRFLWIVEERVESTGAPVRAARRAILGSPDGMGSDTLAVLAGAQAIAIREGDVVANVRLPFVYPDVAAVSADGRFISSGEGYELVLRQVAAGADGVRETRARVAREPRAVTRADWDRAIAADLERAVRPMPSMPASASQDLVRARQRGYAQLQPPSHMPAFDELHIDATGAVWARGYVPPGESPEQREWWVFGQDGRWLTTIELPADLRVLDIGASHIITRWEDELGVQRVRVHDLCRGGAAD